MFEKVKKLLKKPEKYGSITISTTISRELYDKCRQYGIGWAEALRVGCASLLAQKGDEDYVNPKQMEMKIEKLAGKLQEFVLQKEAMEKELNQLRGGKE